jgi:hypothetical protein
LYRNLIAEYLCCGGWFDVYGISVSVKVGFLNIEICMPGEVLWMVMSRKLSLLSCSSSSVNVRLGCMELKSLSMEFMSVCEES